MEKSLKSIFSKLLFENHGYHHLDKDSVCEIMDVSFDKNEDFIRIDFNTQQGVPSSLLTKYCRFKDWFERKGGNANPLFKEYIKEFIECSSVLNNSDESALEEIVDGDGNLYGDSDLPSNGPNKMVGTSTWDLEKVYKTLPRNIRQYSGDLGIGIITW